MQVVLPVYHAWVWVQSLEHEDTTTAHIFTKNRFYSQSLSCHKFLSQGEAWKLPSPSMLEFLTFKYLVIGHNNNMIYFA